jgi:hypothetical protein
MSNGNSYTWIISGRVLKIDAETPFVKDDGLSVRIFNIGNENSLGNYGINDDNGNFSIILDKQRFVNASPDLIIRVYDNQERILYASNTFTLHQSVNFHSMYNMVVTAMPVPQTWNIRGIAFNGNAATPFTQGTIRVYDGQTERVEYTRSGFEPNGRFCLTFDRSWFQNGDFSKTAPYITIRVFDYTPIRIWKRGPFLVCNCEYYINPLVVNPPGDGGEIVPNIPPVDEKWRVRGTIYGENGSPVNEQFTVKAFDVLYEEETELGAVQSNGGTYTIDYDKERFQKGDTGRTNPNLIVRVYSEEGLVTASRIYDQASNGKVIDINFACVPHNWEVRGFASDSQGYLVSLGEVCVYDVSTEQQIRLGSANLDSSGHYSVSFERDTVPILKVYLCYPGNTVIAESDIINNVSPVQTVNLTVQSGSSSETESEYCVYGHVTNKAGLAVAHHPVKSYILRISKDGAFEKVELGNAITDINGYYEASYDPELLEFPIDEDPSAHGSGTDSLFIELPKGQNSYDTSHLVCHSSKRQQIDIQVDRLAGSSNSEYEIVSSALSAYSSVMENIMSKQEQAQEQEQEQEQGQEQEQEQGQEQEQEQGQEQEQEQKQKKKPEQEPDFSHRMQYISCKTGVEENKVVCFYYSMHIAERVDDMLAENFDPPVDFEKFMYATFRAGYPGNDVPALCSAEPGKHYQALTEAIKNRIISESTTANLEVFWAEWLKIARTITSYAGVYNADTASIGLFTRTILELEHYPLFEPRQQDESTDEHEERLKKQKEVQGEIQEKIQGIVNIYQDVQGDMPSFWDQMQAEIKEGDDPAKQFFTQLTFINDLYSISNGFVPFAQGIYRCYFWKYYSSDPKIDAKEAYNIRNLASLNDYEWLSMASASLNYTQGKYPPHLVGETEEERQHILVMMAKKLYEEKFPIENAAAAYAKSENEDLKDIGEFLASAAADGFDLDSTNIDEYSLPGNVNEDTLKALQRVNRLTEDPAAQIYLINDGYDSAYKIATVEEEKFVADYADKLGGVEEARQVHRLAAMYATETLTILSKYHNSLNFSENESIQAVESIPAAKSIRAAKSIQAAKSIPAVNRGVSQIQLPGSNPVPTYKTLFGTLSEAHFKNNQSVFSASAYFTDLLGFIDGLSRENIFSRRPELKEIELTDGNAETILPYIDVAIEILENAISPRMFFFEIPKFSTFVPPELAAELNERAIDVSAGAEVKPIENDDSYLSTGSWRVHFSYKSNSDLGAEGYLVTMYPQTSKESSDLSVMPEHRNPLAYKAMSNLYFPLQLPINPAADEVQETLRLLGTSKCDSIIALRVESEKRYKDLVCANLGISNEVKDLLEFKSPSEYNACELWGLQEDWVSVMSYVPDFMQRTGLNVEGMLDVFALKTLNWDDRTHKIETRGDDEGLRTGDPDGFEIKNLNDEDLINIHRLLRLRGILKCSWKELDCFLHSAHGGALPNDLSKISVSRIFMARHPSISFADIGCFWGNLTMHVDKRFGRSPFEERFLSKKLTDDTVAVFKNLMEGKSIDADDADKCDKALQQALQLSEEDLECILSEEDEFNISSISKVLRIVLLTKALKISIEDFYELQELAEIDLFSDTEPENILYFDDESSRLSAHGIKASDVKKLLEEPPASSEDGASSEDDKWVKDAIYSIREAVNAEEELTRLFSEFTGGEAWIAGSLFEEERELWDELTNSGWSCSVNGGEARIAEDFSLPKDCSKNSTVTWSAVFIAPRESEELDFNISFNEKACFAKLEIDGLSKDYKFSTGDMVEIKVIASKINMYYVNDYYLDFPLLADVPISALIPVIGWKNYFKKLKLTLPAFRKVAEYFKITKMDSNFFKAIEDKEGNEAILQPKDFLQTPTCSGAWEKFKCLLDFKKSYSGESSFSETVIKKIGISNETLLAVQGDNPEENKVALFRSAVQQRLGMNFWNKMMEDAMNALRIRQRDAMTAFLTYTGPSLEIASADEKSSYVKYLRGVLEHAGVLEENGDIQPALDLYDKLICPLDISDGQVGPAQWAILDGRKGYRNSNEIYANFLIDTEMNTEMITSRIVQASAAIQLFVQRVLLGLEPASCLDERDIAQWAWVKNYRVWEANRKVFLYPENWIEPELRDDKTPFFKEFEAEFESGEITSEIAKNALGNFLGKIREVSGLDIIGVCGGESSNPRGKDVLHIIGKTKSVPYKYYYRRCHRKNNLANVWDPWESIDMDIQGNSVLPVMFNGHLYLFWAQFNPVNNPGETESIKYKNEGETDPVELSVPANITVVDLSLCWSALADSKWTEKKQTPSFIDTENAFYTNQNPEANVADRYHFKVKEVSSDYVQIEVSGTYEEIKLPEDKKAKLKLLKDLYKHPHKIADVEKVLKIRVVGIYTIWHNGNVSFKKVTEDAGHEFLSDPKNMLFIENYASSDKSQALTRLNGAELLGRTDGGYKYISANSGQLTGSIEEPGFLMEDSRTYYIEPSSNSKKAATYKIEAVFHPIVKEFQKRFENGGPAGLMRRETQALAMATGGYYGYSYYSYNYYYSVLLGYYTAGDWQAWDAGQNAFELRYLPNRNVLSGPFPMDVVDFNYGTPYGIYNWELFFHAPFLVARQLAANQRYDEALDWYHLIFDPRSNKLSGYERTKRWALNLPAGARFWNFLPFFANADANKTIMELMGLPDSRGEMPDSQAIKTLIDDWKNDPFNPHLIARSRIVSYQKAVVMHYLDALLAWADQKFRIDTLESINEAIQLYILAAEILGSRPQSVPGGLGVEPLSYTQMQAMSMDSFSNAVVRLENSLVKPIEDAKDTSQGPIADSAKQALSLGPKMYYFVVPRNEKLMGYWDLLEDRLFKIRNGMNIEGVKRQLSLFAPPIDPGMLVNAAAAGIDIGTALGSMFAPVPKYRFTFMVQKAIELCNAVQSMGGAVLSALEKKDAEEMARLRAGHEETLLKLSKEVKEMQIDEAGIAIEGLERTKATMEFRREHYEKLISEGVSGLEQNQLEQMDIALSHSETAKNIRTGCSLFASIPDFTAGISGLGSPHVVTKISVLQGGIALASAFASGVEFLASRSQNSASQSGINAGYERREQEWAFQKDMAEKEIEGIDRQILGAQIRKQVTEKELGNLEKQIEQSGEIHAFLKGKYTNKELYQWMVKEVSSLYSDIYKLAYDTAKRAEKSYGFELGIDNSSFIQSSCWNSLRSGLLAGEQLMLGLRRMEMAYIEKNSRELEITKPVSVAQLDPYAILELQETGTCEFYLPEALFDLDFPGHYFRRLRSVRLTIPCVAGPYTSVSATLSLLANSMRKSPTGDYLRNEDGDDSRFVDQRVGIQSIATSQPNDATGMFDFSFRDERYLPFEGAGAESLWKLELPKELRQFDYRTISDVVLHVSYTAREDGRLKGVVCNWLKDNIGKLAESYPGIASFQPEVP